MFDDSAYTWHWQYMARHVPKLGKSVQGIQDIGTVRCEVSLRLDYLTKQITGCSSTRGQFLLGLPEQYVRIMVIAVSTFNYRQVCYIIRYL